MVRPCRFNAAQKTAEAMTRRENSRGMLNDFLQSEECRLTVETDQAEALLHNLGKHDTKIWECRELSRFEEEHPECFRPLTPEEIARGAETTRSIWTKYVRWGLNWNRTLRVPLWDENPIR